LQEGEIKLLWYFKKRVYLVSVILGILVIGVLYKIITGFYKTEINLIIAYLLICIWITICGKFLRHQLSDSLGKIVNILINDCDPEKFIINWLPLIKKTTHSKIANNVNTFLFLNLSTGFLEAGKDEEMLNAIEGVNDFPNNRCGNSYRLFYYNNLFCYYMKIQDLKKAENWLWYMRDIMDHSKLTSQVRQQYDAIYVQKKCIFDMEQKNYDGAEQIMNSMFSNAKNELQRVSAKFMLGKIYLHDSQIEKAKGAFEYVVAHGNKLAKVDIAQGYLKSLS